MSADTNLILNIFRYFEWLDFKHVRVNLVFNFSSKRCSCAHIHYMHAGTHRFTHTCTHRHMHTCTHTHAHYLQEPTDGQDLGNMMCADVLICSKLESSPSLVPNLPLRLRDALDGTHKHTDTRTHTHTRMRARTHTHTHSHLCIQWYIHKHPPPTYTQSAWPYPCMLVQ